MIWWVKSKFPDTQTRNRLVEYQLNKNIFFHHFPQNILIMVFFELQFETHLIMKVPKPDNSKFGYPRLNTSMRYKSLRPKIRWCYQQPFWNWRRNCLQTCVISIRIHVRKKKMNIKGKNRLFFNDLSKNKKSLMYFEILVTLTSHVFCWRNILKVAIKNNLLSGLISNSRENLN